MVQVMETYSDVDEEQSENASATDLITHVAVGRMNVHDGPSLEPALTDAETRNIKPFVVLADSHYGSNKNLERAKQQGVEVVSPSMLPKGSKQEKLTLERFEPDEAGHVTLCPEGHLPVMTSVGVDKIQVLFDATVCSACPFRLSCCASAVDRQEPRHQYTHDRVRQRARRLADQSDEFRDR